MICNDIFFIKKKNNLKIFYFKRFFLSSFLTESAHLFLSDQIAQNYQTFSWLQFGNLSFLSGQHWIKRTPTLIAASIVKIALSRGMQQQYANYCCMRWVMHHWKRRLCICNGMLYVHVLECLIINTKHNTFYSIFEFTISIAQNAGFYQNTWIKSNVWGSLCTVEMFSLFLHFCRCLFANCDGCHLKQESIIWTHLTFSVKYSTQMVRDELHKKSKSTKKAHFFDLKLYFGVCKDRRKMYIFGFQISKITRTCIPLTWYIYLSRQYKLNGKFWLLLIKSNGATFCNNTYEYRPNSLRNAQFHHH